MNIIFTSEQGMVTELRPSLFTGGPFTFFNSLRKGATYIYMCILLLWFSLFL